MARNPSKNVRKTVVSLGKTKVTYVFLKVTYVFLRKIYIGGMAPNPSKM